MRATRTAAAVMMVFVVGCGGDSGSDSDGGVATTSASATDTTVEATADIVDADASLLDAIRTDDVTLAESALVAGADPDGDGSVPLVHLAADRGATEMVKVLVDAGADIEAPGTSNHSALIRAALSGDADMLRFLLDAGADLDRRESTPGRTVLQLVVDGFGSIEVIEALLDAGADIDAKDERGETALASAAFMGFLEAAEVLIDRGAEVNTVNGNGVSPLDWATQRGNDDIVALLVANGAEGE